MTFYVHLLASCLFFTQNYCVFIFVKYINSFCNFKLHVFYSCFIKIEHI